MMYLILLERFIVFKYSSKTPSDPPKPRWNEWKPEIIDAIKWMNKKRPLILYSILIFLSFHFSMAPSLIEIEMVVLAASRRSQSTAQQELKKKEVDFFLIKHQTCV